MIVKQAEIELLNRLTLPEAQRANVARAISNNRHIIWHSKHLLVRKFYRHNPVVAPAAPGIAKALPIIRLFHLVTIFKGLLEQAEFIAQPVAIQRDVMGSRTIEEAGSQAAKAAIAQRLIFDILHRGKICAACAQHIAHFVQNAKAV